MTDLIIGTLLYIINEKNEERNILKINEMNCDEAILINALKEVFSRRAFFNNRGVEGKIGSARDRNIQHI